MLEVKEQNFKTEVLESDKPVIVDFYANWCQPCKMLTPILEQISKENEHVKVVKVNTDAERELSVKYNISALPTIMIFKEGEVTNKLVGLQNKAAILKAST